MMSLGSNDDKVTLDRKAFKALASSTRVDILKALSGTQKTVSDLARDLNMNKATMYQHLEHLKNVKLVKRLDGPERRKTMKGGPHEAPKRGPPRKWVYYKLTWKGKNIVNPGKVRFAVMLAVLGIIGLAIIILATANVMLYSAPAGTEKAIDGAPPAFQTWETPAPDTATEHYDFSVVIVDPLHSDKVTGVDPDHVRIRYGVGSSDTLSDPDIVSWTDVDHVRSGDRYRADITSIEWRNMGGKYLYLRAEATDLAGNTNQTTNILYIADLTEAELIFGNHGSIDGGGGHPTVWTFRVQVRNIGDAGAGAFDLGIYTVDPDADNDGKIDGGGGHANAYRIATVHVDPLEAGRTVNLTRNVDAVTLRETGIPDTEGGGGHANIYLMIDIDDRVREQNELNNTMSIRAPDDLVEDLEGYGPAEEGKDGGSAAPGFGALVAVPALAIVLLAVRSGRRRP